MPSYSSRRKLIEYLFMKTSSDLRDPVKRKCFSETGLFDEGMIAFSDHYAWLRLAGKFKMAYIDSVSVKRREHEMQL